MSSLSGVALGRSGLQVSRICLGTMIFGSQLGEPEAWAVLDQAAELGIDFIDIADVYPVPPSPETWGCTEEIVGRWLKGRRERYVVATKCANRVGPGRNDTGGGRKHIIEACEASLRRLGTDRIDLYYLHHSDLDASFEEAMEALDRLVRDGKVLYIGVSNFEAWQLAVTQLAIVQRNLTRLAAIQPRYNLLHRVYERDLLPLSRELGLGVVPYNPLAAGMLTGKYDPEQPPPEGSRFSLGKYGQMYRNRYWSEAMFKTVEAVREVAAAESATPAQVAVAWLLHQAGVSAPIVGASRPEQLLDTVRAVELRLSRDSLDRLDQASALFG